jgi:hypothetical protein
MVDNIKIDLQEVGCEDMIGSSWLMMERGVGNL